ncbi:MAG: hypothetical protein IAC58_06195 [Firmicutes bacterium]|uniref:Uncharacterized protein n=1 Tax=Candidatus Onthovivens merdipullorum TaxID=2840889 RepID=A0A9D9DJU8_9BACL|nr:hypothetical protein [Candidatus Onthovivens merdipullorum]
MFGNIFNVLLDYSIIILIISLVFSFCFKSKKGKIKAFSLFYSTLGLFFILFLIIYRFKFDILDFYLIIRSFIFLILSILEKIKISLISLINVLSKAIMLLIVLGSAINFSTFINRIITINLFFDYVNTLIYVKAIKIKKEYIKIKKHFDFIYINFSSNRIALNC